MALPIKRSKKEPNYLKKTYLIYGSPKAGKTTTVAGFGDDEDNKLLFFATEPGHRFQEIYKWQKQDAKGNTIDPTCWDDFKTCAKELINEEHDFKAIAIDVADILFKWCGEYVCKKNNIEHESDLGFGKGYALIREEFVKPIEALTQRGYGVIFLSHESEKERQIGPRKVTYIDTTLPNTAKKVIHGLCDYILYFHTDDDGKRYIRTKSTENINAGDRSGMLPEIMEMDSKLLIDELSK